MWVPGDLEGSAACVAGRTEQKGFSRNLGVLVSIKAVALRKENNRHTWTPSL